MVIKNEEMLRRNAPAVFATAPEEGRVSGRYSFLPTTDVLDILQEEGWTPWRAKQVKSRSWSRDHAKHIVQLHHKDLQRDNFTGDSFPEMIVQNAHNGLGGYILQGGIFRLVCENGAVIAESDFGKIHIRHIGFDEEQVVEASRKLIQASTGIAAKINAWKATEMTERSRKDFFADAANLRFDKPAEDIIENVSATRREADKGTDLWTVFNVAQENLVRGGFRNGTTNRMVREITNIQSNVNLNQALWELASTYSLN